MTKNADQKLYRSSATGRYIASRSSGTRANDTLVVSQSPRKVGKKQPDASKSKIERAVFAHIRAMRALGRTEANTAEISKALSIPLRDVEEAIFKLRDKGVRIPK